ncbi:MAG: cytochrome c family protein [Myxococcales bacterium]|nr:cytochrome c family protein [Myxococcales bacterium]
MRRALIGIVAAMGIGLIAGGASAAEGDHTYVGVKKCRTCHKKELIGNQYGAWKEAKHSKAFETLKGDEAVKIAKEKGLSKPPHEAEECLKCHVTAYGKPASAFAKAPLKAADGVQCESCHGPGNDYKKKKTMSDREKSMAAGMWEPGKDEKICTGCHNDESPSWDPAEGFDYEAAKEEIAHAIPEDVKGKYIEIEKKLKAEKKASGGADDEEDEEDED